MLREQLSWRDILIGEAYVVSSECPAVVVGVDLVAEGEDSPYEGIIHSALSAL